MSRPRIPQPQKFAEQFGSTRARWPPQPTTPLIPDFILPGLYLTDLFTARSVMLPTYSGPGRPAIKYILSVLDCSLNQPKPKPVNADKFVQKLIVLDDTPEADLLGKLGEACDWIEECIQQGDGGVLVHCQLGQSRSASVVIAYLMRKQKLSYEDALEKVKKRRSLVRPNAGFAKQLTLWAELEYDVFETLIKENPESVDGGEATVQRKEAYERWKDEQRKRVQEMLS